MNKIREEDIRQKEKSTQYVYTMDMDASRTQEKTWSEDPSKTWTKSHEKFKDEDKDEKERLSKIRKRKMKKRWQ